MAAGMKKQEEKKMDTPGSTRSLRDDAEEQLAHSPKRSSGMEGQTPEQLIHELEVHQVELEIQAEELRSAHIALGESRDKFIDLYDFAPVGYLTLTDKVLIAEVNLAGATLLGVDRNKLINGRFRKFVAQKDFEQWDRYFVNVLHQGEKQVCMLSLKRSDGSMYPARLEGVRTTGSNGATTVRITFSDISDIWQIEALQRKTATLSILNGIISTANKADNLPGFLSSILEESLQLLDFDVGGIYLVDRSTRTAHVVHSKNLPEEFLAEIQPLPIDKKPYDRLFIKNEPIITENYAQIASDRSKKYGFLSMASIPLLSKGVAIGALNVASKRRQIISEDEKQTFISISRELGSTIERMAAEDEIKKVKENLETLFNSIDEMVFVLDMQGNIVAVNDTVQKRLSYTQQELTGTNILLLHVPERRDEALRIVQGMIAGTIDSCPVPVLAKDGTRIEVETKITKGLWNNQEVLIGVTRDITERKRAEEALQRVNQKLNVLSQLTRKDLTNQIFVLSSYLELTKNQLAGQDHTIDILEKSFGAVRVINKTLDYSKDYQDMGAKPPKWQNVKTVMLFGLSHISIGNIQHSLETEDLEIFADPLLEKVCQRLFENSVKHGDHVAVIRVWHTVTPEWATIFFEDDGIGIPQERKEQIFLRSEGTSASRGSLIFVREILDITGITIKETGEQGKGARFEITVPNGMWRFRDKK